MKKIITFFVIFLFLASIVYSQVNMPNPAAVKCLDDGYELETRSSDDGEYGVCMFEDSECGQWDYFRGDCKPKQCNSVKGSMSEGEFKLACDPYEQKGFAALFKKYFFLIFAWMWTEEEVKSYDSFEESPEKEEGIEF